MKLRNIMYRSRKGITPVIALVLLLMMTVAAAGMAYIWFQDVQKQTQETVSETLAERTGQMAGAVSIDAVYEPNVATQLIVSVRNTGSVTFTRNVTVYAGATPCQDAEVNQTQSSMTVSCGVAITDGMIIRAIPPQGTAISIKCDKKDGPTTNEDYCAL